MNTTVTCTKLYPDFPFAHRQHKHDGHCALIHGHNWSFEFTFAAERLDECGFVVDFGKLKWLKAWLTERFDHTLVLNADDPARGWLTSCLLRPVSVSELRGERLHMDFAKIVVVPDCSCEGLAQFLLNMVNHSGLRESIDSALRRVRCIRVRVLEDSKNSATASLTLQTTQEVQVRDDRTAEG